MHKQIKMTDQPVPLQKFISNIKQKGYSYAKVYTQGSEVKFIKLFSCLQRKAFLLQVPSRFGLSSETDHMIVPVENDYRNFRQCEYLSKIKLHNVACSSKENLCIKNDNIYSCYHVDSLQQGIDDVEGEIDTSDDDIVIDDYPVEDIYPVFNMESFTQNIDNFEESVLHQYTIITEAEEEMNEIEVEKLLNSFDEQKKQLKERIFDIHKETYNIRRDIIKHGNNLQNIYKLKDQSSGERDRLRFKVERLAIETEEKIDSLNDKLKLNRNQADLLLKNYRKYIARFDYA